jgi:hypothetical protein
MKRYLLPLILMFVFSLYAEDEAPSSVELIIPPIVIEFENRSEQVMQLKVPDYNDIILPDFEITLPDPGEIEIDDLEFDLPLPDFVEYNFKEGSSFFSEGVLGIGIRNQLIGNISLFRLGQGLRFSLSFAHDGLDGFGQNDAGKGYFTRSEAFEGDFKNGDESFMLSGLGSFLENEDGFQGQASSYISVIHRSSEVELRVSGSNDISWLTGIEMKLSEKILTGEVPGTENELILSLNGDLTWQKDWVRISLEGGYSYNNLSEFTDKHFVETNLKLGFPLNSVDIAVSGGLFWLPGLSPSFPFYISLDGTYKDLFQYQSSGGYLVENYINYDSWNDYPFFNSFSGIEKGWFWDGKITAAPFLYTELGFKWLFTYMDNFISVDLASIDPSNGLFPLYNTNGTYLDLSPFVKLSISSESNFLFGWEGQLLSDKDILRPSHSIFTEFMYDKDQYGAFLSGRYSLDPFISVPSISMGIHYNISEGLDLSLEGEDILGFFSEDRISWGSYIESGGKITLLTKISL